MSPEMQTDSDDLVVEWRTLGLWAGCWSAWALCLFGLSLVSPLMAAVVLILVLVLQSSLSHEALHGHPFPKQWMNDGLALIAPGLFIPYLRFRDTHLAHHVDERLTDPYDDPETNFCDPALWAKMPKWQRGVLVLNNTLLGRMLIGPVISQVSFMSADARAIWGGDRSVAVAWGMHGLGSVLVLSVIAFSPMSIWVYVLSCYAALSVLKIRTFLEHRAHHDATARTAIVQDHGPLSFLFLNNNLHAVHHLHPNVPWYDLPQLYRQNAECYDGFNEGYNYTCYGAVFKKYFVKAKDPVPHPLMNSRWPSR